MAKGRRNTARFGALVESAATTRRHLESLRGVSLITDSKLKEASLAILNSTLSALRDEIAARLRDKHGWQGATVSGPTLVAAAEGRCTGRLQQEERGSRNGPRSFRCDQCGTEFFGMGMHNRLCGSTVTTKKED